MASNYDHAPSLLTWSSLLRSLPEPIRHRVQQKHDIEEIKTTFFDRIDIFLETILCNGYLHPSDIQLIISMSENAIVCSFPSVEALIEPISKEFDTVTEHLIRYLWSQRDKNDRLEARLSAKYRAYCDIVQIMNRSKVSTTDELLYRMNERVTTLQQELVDLHLSRKVLVDTTNPTILSRQISQFKATCIDTLTRLRTLFNKIETLAQASFSTVVISSAVDIDIETNR
ncbi:Hypothetical protein GSB_151632 [Giardia duodenalis]|uniref:Uncharacterized protein n=2 Tax=Giardia intestinalis TaxID=5741 RepID=C6LSY8_GIAIB|nr:Hypothetical protein GL50581_1881 [Giardia intestinalis ATCC 50581]ESU41553.1 Hypothetical protein GSB_151632 [Giardia intestinalis]